MPFDYTPAQLAIIHGPLPRHIPWGSRRIADPALEARVATGWFSRQTWEADGYAFPDHPRPRVPGFLRADYPDLAAEDDAQDAAEAEAVAAAARREAEPAQAAARPEPQPEPAPAPFPGPNPPGGSPAQAGGRAPLPARAPTPAPPPSPGATPGAGLHPGRPVL